MQTQRSIFKALEINYKLSSHNSVVSHVVYEVPEIWMSSFSSLKVENVLFILKSVLEAIPEIIGNFGFCKFTSKMIGITENGETKIWIHEKIHENFRMIPTDSES